MPFTSEYPGKKSMFDDVGEFTNKILGLPFPAPSLNNEDFQLHRLHFMQEELREYEDAVRIGDLIGAADALADLVYVALGTAYQMGLPFNGIWEAVHAANMQKVPGMTKRGVHNDAAKPDAWEGPEKKIYQLIKERENDQS